MLFDVRTPVPDHTGSVGGVDFIRGAALVDGDVHGSELSYFRNSGYTVTAAVPHEPAEPATSAVPKKGASVTAWREYAISAGMPEEEANAMSRDQLAEHFTKEEAGA